MDAKTISMAGQQTIDPEFAARLQKIETIANEKGYNFSRWDEGCISYLGIHTGDRVEDYRTRDKDYFVVWVAIRVDMPLNVDSGISILEEKVNKVRPLSASDRLSLFIQFAPLAPRPAATQYIGRSID